MQKYNRKKAVEYAEIWWNKRNPNFYNFDLIGGDCTNFVSQCLFAGGIEMDFNKLGWFYSSLNSRSPSWTGVNEFYDFATKNEQFGPRATVVSISEVEVGDVVQAIKHGKTFHHNMIITKIEGYPSLSSIFVACHTFDAFNKRLSSYEFSQIRFLHILN